MIRDNRHDGIEIFIAIEKMVGAKINQISVAVFVLLVDFVVGLTGKVVYFALEFLFTCCCFFLRKYV